MSVNISEQFARMSLGEKIILIAGPLLLINSFLPWYSVDLGIVSFTRSGWESPGAMWSVLATLIGVAMSTVVALTRFTSVQIPSEFGNGITWARIHLGLGVAAALFIAIKLLNESSHLGFGFFLGIILVGALAAGGFLMFQDEQKGVTGPM